MTNILLVEDELMNIALAIDALQHDGYTIDTASNGEQALEAVECKEYDLILLDRVMPKMDGLTFLRKIKRDKRWSAIPVIMVTSLSSKEDVYDGINAGAHYYLIKPYEGLALRKIVCSALADLNQKRHVEQATKRLESAVCLIESATLLFQSLEDARSIAALLSRACFNQSSETGFALMELMVNAIEHGNLGISYTEKSRLLEHGMWEDEVQRRMLQQPWSSRIGRIEFKRVDEYLHFKIIDQGEGFDWEPYMSIQPDRVFDLHGRGIAIARQMGFANLQYQGNGNIVIASTKRAMGIQY